MASTMMRSHFPTQQGTLKTQYAYVPQPPPSPPMDEMSKCSLPSISNLLGLADQGSPTSETHPQSQQQQQQASSASQSQLHYSRAGSSKPSTRPSSSHYGANHGSSSSSSSMGGISNARGALPPTPPMSTDASFDGYASPSTKSTTQASVISQPQPQPHARYYETTPPLDAEVHRPATSQFTTTAAAPTSRMQRTSIPAPYPGQPLSYNPSSAVAVASPSYLPPQPNPLAAAAFFPPGMDPAPHHPPPGAAPQLPQVSSLYFQRPLPQVFPPPQLSEAMGGGSTNNNSLWQHHHYISPSAAASFPQSQDRYICPTCNKAFSRPSSLRIHSHSHTGEKPFKCPHAGCGKAFSVRSNMKRHERGCHSFEGGVTGC